MSFSLLCLCAAVVSGAILGSGSLREKELARIEHYELIHFEVSAFAENRTLSFHAFGEDYTVELFPKETLIAPDLRTHAITCHFGGRVVLPARLENRSSLALSNCPNRGIRGSLTMGDEKFFVKPSAYFFDAELNRHGVHQATDEHLIYKVSDLDTQGLPHPHGIERKRAEQVAESVKSQIEAELNLAANRRVRRLADEPLQCELYIVADPSLADEFKRYWAVEWYAELAQWMFDIINSVSEEFEYFGTQWPTAMGSIEVRMVRLEVIESWSGIYASLQPRDWDGDVIDGGAYLGQLGRWVEAHDRDAYDAIHLLTRRDMTGGAWANESCVCAETTPCVANNDAGYGDAWTVHLVAHQLGRQFGAQGDGDDNECGDSDGIMDITSESRHGWSRCTRDYWLNYYRSHDELQCLRNGARELVTNFGEGNLTLSASPSLGDCYELSGFAKRAMNGRWHQNSAYQNGQPYFTHESSGAYFLFVGWNGLWVIDDHPHSDIAYPVYCGYSDLSSCTAGRWWYVATTANGSAWAIDDDAMVSSCDGGNAFIDDVRSGEVKEANANDTAAIAALILAFGVALAVIAGFVLFWRASAAKDEIKVVDFEEEEEKEKSVEVEVEVELECITTR